MSERILIEDVLGEVSREEGAEVSTSALTKLSKDYYDALKDYTDVSKGLKLSINNVVFSLVSEEPQAYQFAFNDMTENNISILGIYPNGHGDSQEYFFNLYEDSSYISSESCLGERTTEYPWTFQEGDIVQFYVKEDEPEPGPEPTPTPGKPGYLNIDNPIRRIAKALDNEIDNYLASKSPMERIAVALERQVSIDNPDAGYLADKDYLERIAIAMEAGAGQGGGVTPTGTIEITENGTHDVTNYASANVNVSGGMVETLLWENVNPDSSINTTRTLTLSDRIDEYDYLHIVWKISTTNNQTLEAYYSTDIIKNMTLVNPFYYLTYTGYARGIRIGGTSASKQYNKLVIDTLSSIGSAASPSPTFVIPLAIYGVSKKGS